MQHCQPDPQPRQARVFMHLGEGRTQHVSWMPHHLQWLWTPKSLVLTVGF
jgi:hypothetical protein